MCDYYRFVLQLLLLLFLLYERGEIIVSFPQRSDVRWRQMLELVHVNH